MGRDKASLLVAGEPLVDWMVRRLGPSFAETLVCGGPASVGARAIPDRRHGAGPLAGIEAGLTAMRTPTAFVLACDMPRATAALAALLLGRLGEHDVCLPRVAGIDQSTCAAYARASLEKITAYLDAGGRRVASLLATLDVVRLDEDELARAAIAVDQLADLDTPEDYAAFLASIEPGRG